VERVEMRPNCSSSNCSSNNCNSGESGGIYQSFVVYGCHNGWDLYL
jgi:hypothetical protein